MAEIKYLDLNGLKTVYSVVDEKIASAKVTKTSELANDSDFQTAADVATKVSEEIAKVVDGAPEAFDTLKEIAIKLSESDDAVAAVVASVAEKASKEDVYTKKEVDSKIADTIASGTVDLTPYLTKSLAETTYQPLGNYLTAHQDISHLATKAELPTFSVFTAAEIREAAKAEHIEMNGNPN